MHVVDRLDRFQRENRWVGFPLGVLYKAVDDRAPHLAALVTYYAFVSLFPLLLLLVAVSGFLLDGHPDVRHQIVNSALRDFPIVGDQLRSNINGFHGSGGALAVGIVGTLYGGLGATQAAQAAFNQIYGVPRHSQPNPLKSRLRSLALVGLLGTGVLVSTGLAAFVATVGGLAGELSGGVRAVGYVATFVLNAALFTAAFQLLTARDLKVRDVITGGLIAGGIWELLQVFGARLVSHEAQHGSALYGVFGVVLATLGWIYLQSLALMIAAEVNVVLHHRLWPRALLTPFTDDVELTEADRRAYSTYVSAQQFKGFEAVHTGFERTPATDPEGMSRIRSGP